MLGSKMGVGKEMKKKSMVEEEFAMFFFCISGQGWVVKSVHSYRDTEKSVRQHIALDKPVHGRLAACMDIVVRPFDIRLNTAVFEYASVRCELFYAIWNGTARDEKNCCASDEAQNLVLTSSTHRFISFEPSKLCVCLNIFCALLSILFIKFEFDSAASVSASVTGSGSVLMSLRFAKYGMNVLQTHRRYISCLLSWLSVVVIVVCARGREKTK